MSNVDEERYIIHNLHIYKYRSVLLSQQFLLEIEISIAARAFKFIFTFVVFYFGTVFLASFIKMKFNIEDNAKATPVQPHRLSPIRTDHSPVRLADEPQPEPSSRTPQQTTQMVRANRARARRTRRKPKRAGRSGGRRAAAPKARRMRSRRRPRKMSKN